MTAEHLIRLRGPWSCRTRLDDTEAEARIDLPTPISPSMGSTIRLARSFGRPPIDPERESLALRFEAVEGLREVRLNGRILSRPAAGIDALELTIDEPLPPRNLLEMDVDPPCEPLRSNGSEPWGCIALVVRGL